MKKNLTDLVGVEITERHYGEEWRLRLALIKESSVYRNFWDNYGGDKARMMFKYLEAQHCSRHMLLLRKKDTENSSPPDVWFRKGLTIDQFPPEYWDFKNQERIFSERLREQFGIDSSPFFWISWEEWLIRIDPYNIDDTTFVWFWYPLPPIKQVFGAPLPDMPEEHRACEIFPSEKNGNELNPSERILRVDLSRKRGELTREFALFLDMVEARRTDENVPEDWKENYSTWEPDNSRFRFEAWQALGVWRLRRKRKTYKEIEQTLEIGLPAAKMAFRRAYELIEGKPYDPEAFKRNNLPVSTSELGKTCSTCPIRSTCKELCPDMLLFVGQDYGSEREATSGALDFFELGTQRSRKDKAE